MVVTIFTPIASPAHHMVFAAEIEEIMWITEMTGDLQGSRDLEQMMHFLRHLKNDGKPTVFENCSKSLI